MTTIVGIQGDGFALVCADSQISEISSDGYATQVLTLREGSGKIAANGRYLFGAAGDLRAINLLHHAFAPPVCPPNLKGKKLDHFITVKFIPALRECFDHHGYATPVSESSEHMAQHGSIILVVINGVIYTVDGDYSWVSDPNGVYALGTGAQYAMGAVHALQGKTKFNLFTAKKTVLQAMAAAAKFDPYTGAPYHSFVQEAEKDKSRVKQVSTSNPKKIGK